ncbi:uncharacterized protein DS421_15g519460 [Arachis hypogaea]|nr:uncharacterized protein DS421_15g519460 [Arachis hypogaea]
MSEGIDTDASEFDCTHSSHHEKVRKIRRSDRIRRPPSYLKDFHCMLVTAHGNSLSFTENILKIILHSLSNLHLH